MGSPLLRMGKSIYFIRYDTRRKYFHMDTRPFMKALHTRCGIVTSYYRVLELYGMANILLSILGHSYHKILCISFDHMVKTYLKAKRLA